MQCPSIILNFIKYIALGLCIIYIMDSKQELMFYLQKGSLIGICMIFVEYVVGNICRDIKENFTTGPGIEEGMEEQEMIQTQNMEEPISTVEEKSEEEKLIEDGDEYKNLLDESTIYREQEQEGLDEEQVIEYGYSYVHPDAMKLPEVRLPKCIQDNPCNVCPIMMGGTNDLLEVKPRKKPIAGC